ncbi:hypothetical protein [Streptomyces sp. NPDC102282]|uniref:hypothetical protein n=1 Tax=Streptomyces sp. NPDC102282 TaxID=3366154 RepID=UPI0037F77020
MTTDSPMPSPPFPSTDNAVLRLIVGNAIKAVHSWYEGHIHGEDECPGCDFRGELPKGIKRG